MGIYFETPLTQGFKHSHMGIRHCASLVLADTVGTHFQGAAGGDFGIQLAQTAGGGVARVNKDFFSGIPGDCIQFFKAGAGQVDLATYFKKLGNALTGQAQRDAVNGANIGGDILTDLSITAGGTAHQQSVFVEQADGDTVELGFADIVNQCLFVEV